MYGFWLLLKDIRNLFYSQQLIGMGGRYHQKYMNFKRFRQEIDGSNIHYKITQTIKKWHSQSTNCSYFFTGIEKCKTKWSRKTQTE